MKKHVFLAGGAIALGSAAVAFAHGGATGVVKQRMDAMGKMKDAVKDLTKIMHGDVPYNAARVKKNASAIKSHAGSAMAKLFPKGSNAKPSEALPEIWADWEDFIRPNVLRSLRQAWRRRPKTVLLQPVEQRAIWASQI